MGTTVTTNLGLIKPDVDEKIQEDLPTFAGWAAQNEINCDKIDALFRHTDHSYVPTWTGSGGNPTLGAGGSVTGKYLRLFPAMVIGEFKINTGGAGFLAGSGTYSVSVPLAIAPELVTLNNSFPIGKAYLHDADSVANSTILTVMYSTSGNDMFFRPHTGAVWSNTAPFTLAQTDRVSGYFMYPTSVA
jgi:hypothetical protein